MMAIVTEMQNVADISVLIIWQSVSLDSACNSSNNNLRLCNHLWKSTSGCKVWYIFSILNLEGEQKKLTHDQNLTIEKNLKFWSHQAQILKT